MKCEKCNEREANFFYTSNINGEVTKKCLCHECAQAEGLMEHQDMFGSFFNMRSPFGLLDSMWSDSFWNDNFFAPFGRLGTLARPSVGEEKKAAIPDKAGDDLMAKREIAQLRAKMQKAVESENFEEAIKLRDEIKARENRA